jgi:hypothetical protein
MPSADFCFITDRIAPASAVNLSFSSLNELMTSLIAKA